jgi:hypothetical protein
VIKDIQSQLGAELVTYRARPGKPRLQMLETTSSHVHQRVSGGHCVSDKLEARRCIEGKNAGMRRVAEWISRCRKAGMAVGRNWISRLIKHPLFVTVIGGLFVAGVVAFFSRDTGPPDPHAVSDAELLRPETRVKTRLYGDLDGVKPDEIIVWSESIEAAQRRPQPYIDIFSWREDAWVRVLDATSSSTSSTAQPLIDVEPSPSHFDRPIISYLSLVDFARDRIPEVVVGVLAGGASGGPLHVYILSLASGHVERLFDERTRVAGELKLRAHSITLETGAYGPNDPNCCPSRIVHKEIGWREGTVQVLRTRYSRRDPED